MNLHERHGRDSFGRVVPFDLRSFSELIGYATGPFLPLLTLTEKLDTPPVKWLITHLSGK